jgi:hypothetical protein
LSAAAAAAEAAATSAKTASAPETASSAAEALGQRRAGFNGQRSRDENRDK